MRAPDGTKFRGENPLKFFGVRTPAPNQDPARYAKEFGVYSDGREEPLEGFLKGGLGNYLLQVHSPNRNANESRFAKLYIYRLVI